MAGDQQPPPGFAPHDRKSRVTDPWEPIYSRRTDDALQIGLWLAEAHCNSRGLVHGGVLAALADNAMGLSYTYQAAARGKAGPNGRGAVTVSLNLDYVAAGQIGQWLQVSPRVIRSGRSMGFVDAIVTADDTPIVRASATFKML